MSHFSGESCLCEDAAQRKSEVKNFNRFSPAWGVGSNAHCVGSMSMRTQFMHVALF